MTTTYTVETTDSPRVPATGTLPALRAIVLRRNGPPAHLGAHLGVPALPLVPDPAPPPRSRIPTTAREVAAHLSTGPSLLKRPAGWVSSGPPPDAVECRALRDRLGIGQREAAEGPVPHVSRSLVAELEHPTRTRRPMGSPTAERYVAWLRQQVARIDAAEAVK